VAPADIRAPTDDDPIAEDGQSDAWSFARPRRMLLGSALDHPVLGAVLEMLYADAAHDDPLAVQGDPNNHKLLWYEQSKFVERDERGWQESDQAAFDEVWTEEARLFMAGALDQFQWEWRHELESAVRRHLPEVWDAIERLAFRADFWPQGFFAPTRHVLFEERARLYGFESRCSAALQVGALHAHLRDGTVPTPSQSPVACALCGEGYYEASTHLLTFKDWGAPRYCSACSLIAHYGCSPIRDQPMIADSLRRLSKALDWIPPKGFRMVKMPPHLDHALRDQAMAELVVLPDEAVIRAVFGKPWLGVLQATGLVGDEWRQSFGTYCFAADGHPCRSLFERQVDDWLHAHDVEHEVEPIWPRHPTFNPSGRLRADWRLGDGTYVEAAGLMERPEYAAKIATKVQLAAAIGERLIVIEPSDLGILRVLLAT
jgi:hypothetical protein